MLSFGIYVHIPFCRTLCPYCDFVKEPVKGSVPERYAEGLCGEIESFEGPRVAQSVFLGGGTPSLIAPSTLEILLNALHRRFDLAGAEITIEANPDDVTEEIVEEWKGLGINRVSTGVQSFDDAALKYLGRRHDAARARHACEFIAAQFDNWSLDLMFGAQARASWGDTLRQAIALSPPHMSAYGLTYEAGTPFGRRSHEAIEDDESLALYHDTVEALSAAGIARYEVSNFARPSHECVHNLIYWRNEPYAGFGTGAYSFVGGARCRNVVTSTEYLSNPGEIAERDELTDEEIRLETVIQHLRLREGIAFSYYEVRFGNGIMSDFGDSLNDLVNRGLIEIGESTIRPTRLGFDLNNEIGLQLVR